MLSLKNSLAVLRKTNALLDGHFVLSSGLHSPSYIQCAKLLSFPNKSEKFTKSLANKIKRTFGKKIVIGFGSFQQTQQMKNCMPTPNKSLKDLLAKHFQLCIVDEFKTSKMCSFCLGRLFGVVFVLMLLPKHLI